MRLLAATTMSVPGFSKIAGFRAEFNGLRTVTTTHDLIGRHGRIAAAIERHLEILSCERPLRVLDVGAYDRAFGRALLKRHPNWVYHSADVDGSIPHDFRDLGEVTGTYDVIAMFEPIEHLNYREVGEMLHRAFELLAEGGKLLISTPNPFHPTRYFSDASHRQHWPAHDLYALLRHVGFCRDRIEMYGVIYKSPETLRAVVQRIRNLIWRVVGIERRGGLLAIATKS